MTKQTLIDTLAEEIHGLVLSHVSCNNDVLEIESTLELSIKAKLEAAFRAVIGTLEPVSNIRLTAEAAEILGKVQPSSEGRNDLRKLQATLAGITLTEEKECNET